jgi:hypothetical protein
MAEEVAGVTTIGEIFARDGQPSHAVTVHGCSSIHIQDIHSRFVRGLQVSEWIAYYGNPAALNRQVTDV